MNITEKQQNRMMDRAFDAACLKVKGEEEWSNQIMTRLKATYPEQKEYLGTMFDFYVNMVKNNEDFLERADYMIEHKKTIRLSY